MVADETMADEEDREKPLGIKGWLGMGLDGQDGHTRISRGPNFLLYGGSKRTHERMQETALKFNEMVDERGKKLEEISHRELREIVDSIHEESE